VLRSALLTGFIAPHFALFIHKLFQQVLDKEFQGMQALVDKARADGEAALADSFKNKLFMQEQYEKVIRNKKVELNSPDSYNIAYSCVLQIVEELSYENEYLRNTCTEQEAQVNQLSTHCCGTEKITPFFVYSLSFLTD